MRKTLQNKLKSRIQVQVSVKGVWSITYLIEKTNSNKVLIVRKAHKAGLVTPSCVTLHKYWYTCRAWSDMSNFVNRVSVTIHPLKIELSRHKWIDVSKINVYRLVGVPFNQKNWAASPQNASLIKQVIFIFRDLKQLVKMTHRCRIIRSRQSQLFDCLTQANNV